MTISIPDYTVTPSGADFADPSKQRNAIVEANATMAALASDRSIAFVDIFAISQAAAADRSLVADDGLHPSGSQYRTLARTDPACGRTAARSVANADRRRSSGLFLVEEQTSVAESGGLGITCLAR